MFEIGELGIESIEQRQSIVHAVVNLDVVERYFVGVPRCRFLRTVLVGGGFPAYLLFDIGHIGIGQDRVGLVLQLLVGVLVLLACCLHLLCEVGVLGLLLLDDKVIYAGLVMLIKGNRLSLINIVPREVFDKSLLS